ncbi:probable methyltransferase PMT15 [Cynara cardunculus var. scolymus]|uniref:probable methyltransferase PMT15 n=1 Tax=Cynara cardunculus var. scolymus TaxID=59895 RepID=UPI000D6293F3|nr:probable methyltransferase PMT15 [Cynara cardunculus var. scolymus]
MASNRISSFLISLRMKKTNIFFMLLTTVLCSSSYLIGNWKLRGITTVSTDVRSSIPCNVAPNDAVPIRTQTPLDFNPHHLAEDIPDSTPAARVNRFPPCSTEFSEYTPCEDVDRSLKFDRERLVYRERHCPEKGEVLKCRIPAPFGYRQPFRWPESRDAAWYANVPHKHLTVEKAGQNWVRFNGDRFTFPGGGTMFPNGAGAYIDDIGKLINLRDGSIRTAIDTGCGVASLGAYLLSRNILATSFAPKDTHVAQVQFALERGVPALIGIIASIRLPYPSRAFDMAHCSRCLIPWGQYDGLYLIEVDRVLRPGGYWILSGPPINWERHWKGWGETREQLKGQQDLIESVARSLCWKKIIQKDDIAIWQKPTNHVHCKINRKVFKKPQFCQNQDPDMAWYTKMEACLTPLPDVSNIKETSGGGPVAKWPKRLTSTPPRIISRSVGEITEEDFTNDTDIWKTRLSRYKKLDQQLADKGRYRNLLDMNSYLGGFAAALAISKDPVWVMNVVPVEANVNTLGVIYERGLIGTYQNWCEAMSTYPRTYDFIHADAIFTLYKDRCEMEDILLEMDRILRPQGSVIIRDDVDLLVNVKTIADELQWETTLVDHEEGPLVREKILVATKQYWTAPAPTQDRE